MTAYAIVLTTTGSEAEAEAIATALVEARLAACVNLFPIQSVYTWQGKLQREAEWQLVIKTRQDCFDEVAAKVRSLHSYDTPELIALPIAEGAADYLGWMGAQVNASGEAG
ncbi:divalent-cation tolerance protein CutA [Leptolyngbya sp. BC1307]|uniref:divalent-cation tolerance protein CutA n=1 Tax=Leptolyngbya sp. BC1307 TaxID=2029589 RepID=UPI000EFC32A5|nr:divalent-cation tolerance protein CutA [Leptolyngbya sp. BC1307]